MLDALAVRHGPSHAEVMWLDGEDAPCLVEVGCRPHGGEGTFVDMVEPVIGYSKLSVSLSHVSSLRPRSEPTPRDAPYDRSGRQLRTIAVQTPTPCTRRSILAASQVMLDAVEKPYRFHRLPTRPVPFTGGAMEVPRARGVRARGASHADRIMRTARHRAARACVPS